MNAYTFKYFVDPSKVNVSMRERMPNYDALNPPLPKDISVDNVAHCSRTSTRHHFDLISPLSTGEGNVQLAMRKYIFWKVDA